MVEMSRNGPQAANDGRGREGLCTSHLTYWRKQRRGGTLNEFSQS